MPQIGLSLMLHASMQRVRAGDDRWGEEQTYPRGGVSYPDRCRCRVHTIYHLVVVWRLDWYDQG